MLTISAPPVGVPAGTPYRARISFRNGFSSRRKWGTWPFSRPSYTDVQGCAGTSELTFNRYSELRISGSESGAPVGCYLPIIPGMPPPSVKRFITFDELTSGV